MTSELILEVCVASTQEAKEAQAAGADRLELNSALQLGGLTPSPSLVNRVLSECSLPVIAMARPRAGGFCYSDDHWKTMLLDIEWMIEQGMNGIAFGCLTAERTIDISRVKEVCQRAGGAELVFHRAFDLIEDWQTAVDQLAECGVKRIMTSGGADTVPAGLAQIREVVEYASERIGVIPAGGVTPCNLAEVVQATGCTEIHGTFSSVGADPGYEDGPIRFAVNDQTRVSNPDKVRRAKEALLSSRNSNAS